MAKNNPGEASTNWFISLKDNSQNLDFQAGGFAAFARVIGGGKAVADAIDALEDATYSGLTIGASANRQLTNFPLTEVTPESPLNSQLVVVTSVERIDPMTFELVGSSEPGNVAASLTDGMLTLEFLGGGGESIITVAATDLDGARTETSFTATSLGDYAAWAVANGAGVAGGNADGGILTEAQEYAFGGDPDAALDDTARAPMPSETEVEGETYDAIVFYHRKYSSDLTYTVQTSSDLSAWADIWATADGNAAPLVRMVEDAGDFWKITVRQADSQSAGDQRFFLRVKVTLNVE